MSFRRRLKREHSRRVGPKRERAVARLAERLDPDRVFADIEPRPLSGFVAYGANCTWWHVLEAVGCKLIDGHRMPCCPHCGTMLFQIEEAKWWVNVDDYAVKTADPDYRAFVEWMRGKCFPTMTAARAEFAATREERT